MKIRDAYATLTGDKTEHAMQSGGLEIVSDNGCTLFCVIQQKDGSIEIRSGSGGFHQGKVLQDRLLIIPHCANVVSLVRPEYITP